ncbi:MAG: hypothetical protein IPM14_08495 [bacterium]|nr:hypothetical protein [bacterium]
MFEKEIKFIGDFCFNQVRSLGNTFTLDKIITSGMHPAVVQYISAELEYMIYSDRQKLLQQSYFDYTGREISDHFQKISNEIKKHKKVSIDDSKKLIFQAVSFNINYLVRPRWSLTKLIFNEQPVVSAEEMKMMFNYLYYYEYFKKVLTGYIDKRNLMQISSTEFEIILDKIDNELISSNQKQVVSNSFISIGDFFNIGGVDKNLLPLTAVEIFCKEKNLLDLLVKLRKVIPNDIKRRYDRVEIERILFAPDKHLKDLDLESVETEITTDEMIEKIHADEINSAQKEQNEISEHDEMQKADLETFLSPEEEEALLSLYSEESKSSDIISNEEINTAEENIIIEEESEVVSLSDTNQDGEINFENDIIGDEPESAGLSDLDERESGQEIFENTEQEVVSTDEEVNKLVDAITEDMPSESVDTEETIPENIEETEITDSELNQSDIDSELSVTSVEKEIVQEMIEDMYIETETVSSEVDDTDEFEIKTDTIPDNLQPEVKENKIKSLEDDLLNIFEDLDNINFTLPEKGKQFQETEDVSSFIENFEMENETKKEEVETDSFDDYLKNIDEVVFTDTSAKKTEKSTQIKNEFSKVKQQTEIQEDVVPSAEKVEKPVVKPRNIRPKDLFSYLRRKEIKKIVSFIFANDEEDFTNTVERIMDCHSYKEASEILKAVFTSYKISPYSKEAITFTNAVSNYFRQA